MTASTSWDRAAALPVSAGTRATPEVAALGDDLPSVDALFTFMRDAELRFDTLRMRMEERVWNARGEDLTVMEVALRHPGEAKVLSSRPAVGTAANYEVWATDGTTVRTYAAGHGTGTRRPVRTGARGVGAAAQDLPGTSRVFTARTPLQAETLPDLFVHPAGFCQNVLATGACAVTGTTSVAGRAAIVLACNHPRTVERVADRADYRVVIAVDRLDGTILSLEESLGGVVTRLAVVTSYQPNVALAPSALAFTFPSDTTFIY